MSQKKLFNWLYATLMLMPIVVLFISNYKCFNTDNVISIDTFTDLYTWTTSSMFYEPIFDFCKIFNYDSLIIPTLFTYWLTTSCLFLIFDMLMFVIRWARSRISALYSRND